VTTKELAQLQFLQLVAVWIKIPGINGWRTPELKKITGFTVLGIRRCSLSAFSTLLFCVAEESLPSVSSFQTFHLLTIEAAAFFLAFRTSSFAANCVQWLPTDLLWKISRPKSRPTSAKQGIRRSQKIFWRKH